MSEHEHGLMGLREVAQVLGVAPWRITYALAAGYVPEPAARIAGKRVFDTETVERLRRHFVGDELRTVQ